MTLAVNTGEISRKYVLYTALADLSEGKGEVTWNRNVLDKLVKVMDVKQPVAVQSLLNEMEKHGFVKRTRKADGREIDTIILVSEPPIEKMSGRKLVGPKTNGAVADTSPRPTKPIAVRISTPLLNEYVAAKEFSTGTMPSNKYLQIEFKPDPLAEEYLNLFQSHVRIVEKFNAQSAELAEANRALGFFRKTTDGKFRQALKDAGVAHGD